MRRVRETTKTYLLLLQKLGKNIRENYIPNEELRYIASNDDLYKQLVAQIQVKLPEKINYSLLSQLMFYLKGTLRDKDNNEEKGQEKKAIADASLSFSLMCEANPSIYSGCRLERYRIACDTFKELSQEIKKISDSDEAKQEIRNEEIAQDRLNELQSKYKIDYIEDLLSDIKDEDYSIKKGEAALIKNIREGLYVENEEEQEEALANRKVILEQRKEEEDLPEKARQLKQLHQGYDRLRELCQQANEEEKQRGYEEASASKLITATQAPSVYKDRRILNTAEKKG